LEYAEDVLALIRPCVASECGAALEASPFCADDSWSLWFATKNPSIDNEQYGYFCCLPGQVGLMTADCVESDTVVAATLSASLVRISSLEVSVLREAPVYCLIDKGR
jgi:hypothetical protein